MGGDCSVSGSFACSPFASGISSSADMTPVWPVALLSPTRSPRQSVSLLYDHSCGVRSCIFRRLQRHFNILLLASL
jgi:hypothetical protein